MKKTELYLSIDGIKQDRHLKERILKAAEEKDEITVIKRPVFVPVMIALLLCLNVGMIAKLVIFNKSQVNMSEFKARTSMSNASDISDEIEEEKLRQEAAEQEKKRQELEQSMEDARNEIERLENEERFQNAKEFFLAEMDMNNYEMIGEWTASSDYDPTDELPIHISELLYPDSGNSVYRRYVQIYTFIPAEDNTQDPIDVSTNHEYIIGYDGKGYEPENIISITESDVTPQEINKEEVEYAYSLMYQPIIYDKVTEIGKQVCDNFLHYNETTEEWINVNRIFVMFQKSENEKTSIIYQCLASITFEIDDGNVSTKSRQMSDYFFLNTSGEDITERLEKTYANYWKETVYNYESTANEEVQIPNVIGMSITEAENALKNAGLKISSRTYEPPADASFNHDEVMSVIPSPGETVYKDSTVDVIICGKMLPELSGYTIEDAVSLLDVYDLKAKIVYDDGVDSDSKGLYVDRFSPSAGTAVSDVDEVTLYIAAADTYVTSALIGCAINLDDNDYYYRKIYSREETEALIKDKEITYEDSIYLSTYGYDEYNDIIFYGCYYDDLFYIQSFKSFSKLGMALPYLQCGMSASDIMLLTEYEFYKEHNAVISKSGNQYELKYFYEDGRNITANIQTQNNIIEHINVSE